MSAKILCLNLFEGGLFWDNIASFIKRENPDILCLQEVNDANTRQPLNFQTRTHLKHLLPDFCSYYSPEIHEVWPQGGGDGGNAIYSRFPIKRKKTTFLHREYQRIVRPKDEKDFSHYPKNLQHVVIDVGGKGLHVCNMHGVWGLDGGDTPERLRMSKIIVDEVKHEKPLVLMGDFNVKPDTQTITEIEKQLINVFKGELVSSFNMRHKKNPGYATAVVDMFFMSKDLRVVSKSVPEDDVSDHKPLLVTIEL